MSWRRLLQLQLLWLLLPQFQTNLWLLLLFLLSNTLTTRQDFLSIPRRRLVPTVLEWRGHRYHGGCDLSHVQGPEHRPRQCRRWLLRGLLHRWRRQLRRLQGEGLRLQGESESRASKSEARQFAAEMALLTAVQQPNICRLLGVSTDGNRRCLVLEFCPSGTLETRLKRDQGLLESQVDFLGWKQRLHIAVGIVRALTHLHSIKPAMIHRDVNTQNVPLIRERCSDGDWLPNTKVFADFGDVQKNGLETRN